MKKFALLLATLPLFASYEPYLDEPTPEEAPCIFDYPYHFEGGYIRTGKGDFKGHKDQNLIYAVGEAKLSYLFPLSCGTGVLIGAGYAWTEFDWHKNPFFNQSEYQEVNVTLSAFTECVNCWLWKGSIGLWQQTEKINVGRYAIIDGILWGRYTYNKCIGLHAGVLALVGKRKALVRPIIGFDYKISKRWMLNAAYPVDMSIVYCMSKQVSLSGALRFNRTRMRTGPVEPVPEAIWEYRSWGGELKLTYEPLPNIRLDIFAGSTFFGWVKVRTRMDKRVAYRELKPVGYVGGYAYAVF